MEVGNRTSQGVKEVGFETAFQGPVDGDNVHVLWIVGMATSY